MEDPIIQKSLTLAQAWQEQANRIKTSKQKEFDEKVAKMVRNPVNKVFLTELIDQSFRPKDTKRVSDQILYLLRKYENVDLFDRFEELLIELFQSAGKLVPAISVPAIVNRIRGETSDVILDAEKDELVKYIKKRRKEDVGVNLNVIGEALLGEEEAQDRIKVYEKTISLPEVNYISIKISTIYSQINPLSFDHTVEEIEQRLTRLYRCAQKNGYKDEKGKQRSTFINLDMEEYRDLALTVESFKRTLDQAEFKGLDAGIVLQAYLPDSLEWLKDLTEWAKKRTAAGGAPIKIRIVKGANMDMEQTEASMKCWPQAPYHEKVDTDANYKRMLRYALRPENAQAVHLGIASHNLFELAHARLLAEQNGTMEHVVFEMLEGMADATARTILKEGIPILLYAPVATKENFTHAIAYYVRRLDENTSPQNFLTHSFNLEPGDDDWRFLADQFKESFRRIEKVRDTPFRQQDRLNEPEKLPAKGKAKSRFTSEPDTDWTLLANRQWAGQIVEKWRGVSGNEIKQIPASVGEAFVFDNLDTKPIIDQGQYEAQIEIARHALATTDMADEAMDIAEKDESGWGKLSPEERHEILRKAAQELRRSRGDLIGVAAAEVGKLFTETDTEVSEAVDFAEFYPLAMKRFARRSNLKFKPKGVGLVIPPWNFPIAIPAGGVLASLAAGNNTIFKPSPQAVYCGWLICEALWKAGVPRKALQFLPCANDPVGSHLVAHEKTSFVIFTGSTKTALKMLKARPRLQLYAETGGKNAMVVSPVCDKDKAIADIIQSAYGNTGQKCSATSLVLLQRSLYEDKHFRRSLVDAAKSLEVGYPWKLSSKMGPLANPVGGPLEKALESLSGKEEWALKPEISPTNPHMMTPGILWNVTQKSYCYRNELFGPVIGVMPYDTLDEAIRLVNETNYGLTSGLQSLDEREIQKWREAIRAGNLYINRGTTGAIVMRQPFGGMAKSAIGPGIKVGSWNYPLEFTDVEEVDTPDDTIVNDPMLDRFEFIIESYPGGIEEEEADNLRAAFQSSLYEYENVFCKIEDYFRIRGEANQSRYLKIHDMIIRVEATDTPFSVLSRMFNAKLAGVEFTVSASPDLSDELKSWLKMHAPELKARYEEAEQSKLCEQITEVERIRFASPEAVSDELYATAAKKGIYIAATPPQMDGRLELLLYHREQCVTHCYHRYGNLGQHQLNPHAEDVMSPGALPDEVYRRGDDDEDEEE